jgi:hypothetical protein
MVAGLNMLSFDLFGLGRRKHNGKAERVERTAPSRAKSDDSSKQDGDHEHELFFWSLYPVM